MGNAMGCIVTAFQNKTSLIITAGQQTREMLLLEPLLTNIESVNLPRPWVKWAMNRRAPRTFLPPSCAPIDGYAAAGRSGVPLPAAR